MNVFHKRAVILAGNHFSVSLLLGIICFLYFYGAGLSDAYHEDPVWIRILIVILWILQFPTLGIFAGARHVPNVIAMCLVGAVWSLAFGYLAAWSILRFKNRRAKY